MDLSARAAELTGERRPFVRATVVRAQQPTSTRPGDRAIVLPDGMIEGFVGGHCVHNSVRRAALDAVASGESVLLRILPDGGPAFPDAPGADVVVNPCLSGGAMEIFLEPCLPAPIVRVAGATPVADAVARVLEVLDVDVRRGISVGDGEAAVIVASLGGDEPAVIREALDSESVTSDWWRAAGAAPRSSTNSTSTNRNGLSCTPRQGFRSVPELRGRSRCRSRPNWCARSGPDSWIRLRPRRNRMRPSLSSIRCAA